jgi:large subunit ribosomal protein L24
MKLKIGDNIVVIAGKDKGKTGKITRILRAANKIIVEKVNIRTKHIKKTAQKAGEKIQYEAAIDASNVMFIDPKSNKRTRLGYRKLDNGKKERITKNSGVGVDTVTTKK